MKVLVVAALAAFGFLVPPAGAQEPSREDLAGSCAVCHGEGGNSRTENVPSLAGHPAPYLSIQLILFRERQRQNEVMAPIAKALSDADVERLAAYFAKEQRRPPALPPAPETAARGKAVADAHRCGVCHLSDYSGREQIPRLAGQRADYLVKTMRDYKAGRRSGLDGMMTSVLHNVGEADIAALAAYLARLP
jgi:cytochrome c553